MRITLLGTGCPVAHPSRAGAATLVEAGGAKVLFDCGSMVTQRLIEAGCPGMGLDALIVSHLHSDHLVDFYQLVVSSWHQGRAAPWTVHCPETVVPVIEATMDAWRQERDLRIAFEQRPSATGFEVSCEVLAPGAVLSVGDLSIEPVLVEHAPVVPAYGFVLRAGGKTAVISGDTSVSEALIEAGQGANLLIHEVYMHHNMAAKPGARSDATIRNTAAYHTLSTEVGGVADRMGAKALALTHFVPPDFDRAALIAEVAQSFRDPIFVGEDLMCFDLGAGEVSWRDFRARLL
ncbi:MAG: MBL fold metallo-hydrolase [Paracoccaceae bacterium]|nr:MBL fold metallo-hydrolase [Paracoccaceae bacterium]